MIITQSATCSAALLTLAHLAIHAGGERLSRPHPALCSIVVKTISSSDDNSFGMGEICEQSTDQPTNLPIETHRQPETTKRQYSDAEQLMREWSMTKLNPYDSPSSEDPMFAHVHEGSIRRTRSWLSRISDDTSECPTPGGRVRRPTAQEIDELKQHRLATPPEIRLPSPGPVPSRHIHKHCCLNACRILLTCSCCYHDDSDSD